MSMELRKLMNRMRDESQRASELAFNESDAERKALYEGFSHGLKRGSEILRQSTQKVNYVAYMNQGGMGERVLK